MNETEVLKQYIESYQMNSIHSLPERFGKDEYWELLHSDKLYDYVVKNNLLDVFVDQQYLEKNYIVITKEGNQYRVKQNFLENLFNSLEKAVKHKLKEMVFYTFSSLSRK